MKTFALLILLSSWNVYPRDFVSLEACEGGYDQIVAMYASYGVHAPKHDCVEVTR